VRRTTSQMASRARATSAATTLDRAIGSGIAHRDAR
jgi:hypothetical protein